MTVKYGMASFYNCDPHNNDLLNNEQGVNREGRLTRLTIYILLQSISFH